MKVNQLSKRMHFLSAYRSVYPLRMLREHLNPARDLQTFVVFSQLPSWVIIPLNNKITISSILIGLKNSYFPLIHLPSCFCRLNQPIIFKVVVQINQSQPWL